MLRLAPTDSRPAWRAARLAALAALAIVGCGRSHDLGVTGASSGAGGAVASSASHASSGTGGAPATSGTGGTPEPSGPTRLTIVNGINDYDAVRVCFLPGDTAWPAAPGGLPFGTAQTVDLTSAVPQGTDLSAWLVAGNLAATAGKTCTEMLALAQPTDGGPLPSVVATQLATIPMSVLASNKSLLLVPTGCMGGPGHDDPNATKACGMGYTSTAPTTGAVLLAMSRITDKKHVSLQVVSASPVLPTTDVRLVPGAMGAMAVNVAPSLLPGAIAPYPPFAMLAPTDFGPLGAVQLQTYLPGSSQATSTTMLSDVLAKSTVGVGDFVDGASLVLIAVGGAPGLPAGAFWHKLTYALIKADPG